jgi:hypothetical protein
MSALALSESACSLNETLPMRAWTMPAFSTRYSILPPLASRHGVATSNVTVPTFGFGMRPRGAEDATELADGAHHVGRRDHAIEVQEPFGDLGDQVVASGEVGAGLAGLALLLALGEDEDADGLPVPCGRTIAPRTI